MLSCSVAMVCCCRLWLSVLRAQVCVEEEKQWECEVTLACGEMWEYLYHNHSRINYITKPVSVSPVSHTPSLTMSMHLSCRYSNSMVTTPTLHPSLPSS